MTTLRLPLRVQFWQSPFPWIVILFAGLFFVSGWNLRLQTHAITKNATHRARVAQCLASRPSLLQFNKHVRGVNELAHTLVTNSAYTLEHTLPNDQQRPVRLKNLKRLVIAREKIAALTGFPVPTVDDCKHL